MGFSDIPVSRKRAILKVELKRMAEDKHLDEKAKKHFKHKPYKCDLGGDKNE